MRRIIPAILACLLILSSAALAQQVQFGVTSSPNVVGSGARALGVGGAFIATADDATAASWNPAALIILERPEVAIMGSYESRKRMGNANFADFNYIAGSYPFKMFHRNMIVSLNYQRLLDFHSTYNRSFTNLIAPQFTATTPVFEFRDTMSAPPNEWNVYSLNTSSTLVNNLNITDKVTGDIGAIAPAFAIQIIPQLSAGVTLNFWKDGLINNGYSRHYDESQSGMHKLDTKLWFDTDDNNIMDGKEWGDLNGNGLPDPGEGEVITYPGNSQYFTSRTSVATDYDLFGVNANFGLLWKATSKIRIGAVYKLPFTARMNVHFRTKSEQILVDANTMEIESTVDITKSSSQFELSFPAVYGLGGAYRFNDNLTAALDVSYTDWPEFQLLERVKVPMMSPRTSYGMGGDLLQVDGSRRSAVNGLNMDGYCDARVGPAICSKADANFHKKPEITGAFTARLGVEYLFILPKTIIPARLGFMYDPEPALNKPDDFWGISAGTGIVLKKRFIFDVAYQYRWSNSAHLATVTSANGSILFSEDIGKVSQSIFMLSSIMHF